MSNHTAVLDIIRPMLDSNAAMAAALLESILKKEPEQLEALQLLGLCRLQTNQIPEATAIFQKLLVLDPTAANHANLATCYARVKSHNLAIEELKTALEIDSNESLLWSNLAIQYHTIGNNEQAFLAMDNALKLNPNPILWNNLGSLHTEVRNFQKASTCYEKAILADSGYVTAHVNLALVSHFLGDWQKGFKEFEWRFLNYPEMVHYLRAYDRSRLWDGKTSLHDKRLLIHGEQGFGDILMFARFAKQFKDLGAHVTINAHHSLKQVISQIEGVDAVVDCDIYNSVCRLPEYDYQISSVSAPFLLGLNQISGAAYIPSHPTNSDTLRVGLVWAGNQNQPDDHERSIPYEIFKELLIPGIEFYSLQIGERATGIDLQSPLSAVRNFEDTRLFLNNIDLVIGCQTAVIHLAGAMGKPVWTLLAYDPDWRWGISSHHTFWYDSMQLFRQTQKGDWQDVVNRVRLKLQNLISS